jgi:hypothetical protein
MHGTFHTDGQNPAVLWFFQISVLLSATSVTQHVFGCQIHVKHISLRILCMNNTSPLLFVSLFLITAASSSV